MNAKVHCQAGVTLVELLVAITIFAVGLLAIAAMQITSVRANFNSNIRSTSIAAGQGALEDLTARADTDPIFNDPDEYTGTVSVDVIDGNETTTYDANYTVTPDTPIPNMYQIVVKVVSVWDSQERYTLTSYKREE